MLCKNKFDFSLFMVRWGGEEEERRAPAEEDPKILLKNCFPFVPAEIWVDMGALVDTDVEHHG